MTSTTTSTRPGTTPATGITPATEIKIRARGLRKTYRGAGEPVHALAGIDLDIATGGFTAIMGPSGSGKSTLLHCLAGLDTVSSGSIAYADAAQPDGWLEITGMSDRDLTRLRRDRVGFVFQSYNLLPTLTAEQNILLPLDLAGARPDRARFDSLVRVLGLADRLDHRPAQLSGGQQQRVACARALITAPAVLFADEPTGNLDPRATAQVLSFLRRSVRELGQTIVMITHDPNAAAHADRVVLVADGRLAGELTEPSPATVLQALLDLDGGSEVDGGLAA